VEAALAATGIFLVVLGAALPFLGPNRQVDGLK